MDIVITQSCGFPCFGGLDIGALFLGIVTAGVTLYVVFRDSWDRRAPTLEIGHEISMYAYPDQVILIVPIVVTNDSATRATLQGFALDVDGLAGRWRGVQRWVLGPDGKGVNTREGSPTPLSIAANESRLLDLEVGLDHRLAQTVSSAVTVRVRAVATVAGSRPQKPREYPLAAERTFTGPPNVISEIWLGERTSGVVELTAPIAVP